LKIVFVSLVIELKISGLEFVSDTVGYKLTHTAQDYTPAP